MAYSRAVNYECFQELYRQYGDFIWRFFQKVYSERGSATIAMTEFFYTLCNAGPEAHTLQSVLAAAYDQLALLPDPRVAQRALRAVLQEHRATWREVPEGVAV